MKVLVMGGTGAMGRFLVRNLLERGDIVYVTTRSAICHNNLFKEYDHIHYLYGNAHDESFIRQHLHKNWDCIVDFMVYSTAEFKNKYKLFLESAGQYIFLSSARVYADTQDQITENSPRLLDVCRDSVYLATDEYALAKARQEDLLRCAKKNNWTVVRPSITYADDCLQLGVFEKEYWLSRALNGKSIVFSSDIAIRRTAMAHGEDVARAISILTGNSNAYSQIFQIASPKSIIWNDILNIYLTSIESCIDRRPNVYFMKNMDELKLLMGNHWQIYYGRYFNRTFNSSKIIQFCMENGYNLKFRDAEEGLSKCIRNFILKKLKFKFYNVTIDAYMDRIVGEYANLRNLSLSQKLEYRSVRYLPFLVSYFNRKVINETTNCIHKMIAYANIKHKKNRT